MRRFLRAYFFAAVFCFFHQVAFAQHWQWVKSSTATLTASGLAIVADAAGNSFVTGYFTEKVTFGSTTLISSDEEDIFLVKYNAAGEVVWAISADGTGRDFGYSIALDKQSNILITGRMKGSGPFLDKSDIFVSKYDATGNLIWTQTAGGTGTDVGSDIAVDAAGNSYVAGQFEITATFGDTTLTGSFLTGMTRFNNFLAKYDSDGKVVWVKIASGTIEDYYNSVGLDARGNIYLAGSFKDSTTIGSITLTAHGFDDLFLAKFGPNGDVVWAKRAGGAKFDFAQNLAVDAAGNCYIIGIFTSVTASFDAITITNKDVNGDHFDVFISKYDATGKAKWAKLAGGIFGDLATDIAIDEEGNSYAIGAFWGTSFFGATSLTSETNWDFDVFISKLNPAGEFVWAKQVGGPPDDNGNGIAVDAKGNGYVTGAYNRNATFDNFELSGKEGNMFIAKFGPTPLPEPPPEPPIANKLFIPNIITPNGDGLNDTFVPRIPENIPVNLKVYNRWGQTVYEQANYQNTWNGENQSDGTYYYLLSTAAGQSWKGWIEISR